MYRLDIAEEAVEQLAALPRHALMHTAELMSTLGVAPAAGTPYHWAHPDGTMFSIAFGPRGQGLAIYELVEDQRWVSVLRIFWVE